MPNTPQNGTLKVGDMGGDIHNGAAAAGSGTVQNLGTLTETPGGAAAEYVGVDDPAGQYETAFALMKNGSFESSRKAFDAFIAQNPSHPLAANATYWIGENYYAEGNYSKAVRAFAESYKKYPDGPKGADSLLKMGMSLGKLGKNQQACVTFEQLKKEYRVGEAGILRRASDEGAKLGCAN